MGSKPACGGWWRSAAPPARRSPVCTRAPIRAVLHPSRRAERDLVDPLIDMWCRCTPADHEGQIRAALNRRDARDVLPGIACPTLVLGGAEDPWAPADGQREIAAAIPGATLVPVPDCGHMVAVERPEVVTEAMRRWLNA